MSSKSRFTGKPAGPRGPFVVWFGGDIHGWPSGNSGINKRYRTVAAARRALAEYTKANPLEDVAGEYSIRSARGRKV